jgi:hypothetical protein
MNLKFYLLLMLSVILLSISIVMLSSFANKETKCGSPAEKDSIEGPCCLPEAPGLFHYWI